VRRRLHHAVVFVICVGPVEGVLHAQAPAAQSAGPAPAAARVFTLEQALQYAAEHYPTLRAALEQVNAASAGVAIARSAYLPRLDSVWQSNRATANNVFGQVLPQSIVPAISGPVLPSASSQAVWGSVAGALFSWEAFDFGLRGATITGAETTVARARADQLLTQVDVEHAAGDAFLAVAAAERAVTAAQADLDRRDVLARAAHALADNQLRPGAEASRADAERAAAQTRLIRARQQLTVARAVLARSLGIADPVAINSIGVIGAVPPQSDSTSSSDPILHPLAQLRQAAVDAARAQETVLGRTDLPRVYLQSSIFARGTGASPTGTFDGGASGLGLDRTNWAGGVQVVFPNLFDFPSRRARRAASAATTRAEVARYDESVLTIASEQQEARTMVEAARAIATNTPVQLAAAQQSESQARARYQAGLASIVEVADAQNLLAQAEYEDEAARVDVWRALLAEAVARGDLRPFIGLLRAGAGAP
jgi:outer membrane protein